jgi:hypothetical protein
MLATLFLVAAAMAPPASSACPPWVTVSHGIAPRSLPAVNRGFVAGNVKAGDNFHHGF